MFAQNVTSFGAFLAGLLSFLSPCILPLVPSYIAFISGVSILEVQSGKFNKLSLFLSALFFVLGFSFVFIGLGATASTLGNFFVSKSSLFMQIGGIIVIFFGLVTAKIINIPFLQYEKKLEVSRNPLTYLGAFIVGVVFAFGWSPCVGPILAAILTLAAQQETVGQGIKLLAIYSAGLAIPFLVLPFAINPFFKFMARVRKYLGVVELAAGKLLVVMGMMLALGTFQKLSESMGEVTILSASILVTFVSVAITQIWILVSFVNWLNEKGHTEIPWSARLLFFIDLLSVAMLHVIATFKEHMTIPEGI